MSNFRLLEDPPCSGTWASLPPLSHCSCWLWEPWVLRCSLYDNLLIQARRPRNILTFRRRLTRGNWWVVPRFSISQKFKCRELCQISSWIPPGDWVPKPSPLWRRCFKTVWVCYHYPNTHILFYSLPMLASQEEGLICISLLLNVINRRMSKICGGRDTKAAGV